MGDGQFKPGVAAIIIIAIGILIFTLLFIFGKRQIMRMAQKFPTDSPHAPIGYAAPKDLCQKIERRLNAIKQIQHEPLLVNPDNKFSCDANASLYKHIYRMKAVDMIKDLEDHLMNAYGREGFKRRHPNEDLRTYLFNLKKDPNSLLNDCESSLINDFVDMYLHARGDPEPDFGPEEFHKYQVMFERIKSQITIPNVNKSPRKSSPAKITNRKTSTITKGLTGNLSFKNLASISSSKSDIHSGTTKNDETCV